jgi:hypothetical protein
MDKFGYRHAFRLSFYLYLHFYSTDTTTVSACSTVHNVSRWGRELVVNSRVTMGDLAL